MRGLARLMAIRSALAEIGCFVFIGLPPFLAGLVFILDS
jgi:hypothetical protein